MINQPSEETKQTTAAVDLEAGRDMEVEVGGDMAGRDVVKEQVINYGNLVIGEKETSIQMYRHVSPPSRNRYVSRPSIEDKLREALLAEGEQQKLILVTGRSGTGRSNIVYQVVTEAAVEEAFPDGTLLGNLRYNSINEILSRFISVYEPDAPDEEVSKWNRAAHLRKLLKEKRLLVILDNITSVEEIAFFKNSDGSDITVIAICPTASLGIEEKFWQRVAIKVPKLSAKEAQAFFKHAWRDAPFLDEIKEEVLLDLAREMHFLPKGIVRVARDILRQQVMPDEYLETLKNQPPKDFGRSIHLSTVYEQLPEQGRKLLPYLGVMNTDRISVEALQSLSRHTKVEVEAGLRQLMQVAFVEASQSKQYLKPQYIVPSDVREFARLELVKQYGSHMVTILQSLIAKYYLQVGEDEIELYRKQLLEYYLREEQNQRSFIDFFAQLVKERGGTYDIEEVATGELDWQGVIGTNLVQSTVEKLIIASPRYGRIWRRTCSTLAAHHLLTHLRDAFGVVVTQEDWTMVRRFANVNLGGFMVDVTHSNEVALELSFMLCENFIVHDAFLSDFYVEASRMIDGRWENCTLLSGKWLGVVFRNVIMKNMDMVGIQMMATTFYDSELSHVDFRNSDLRGVTFFRCKLTDVNFRNADLADAMFVECTLNQVDFRYANLGERPFHNCYPKEPNVLPNGQIVFA